jgi:hypothetical protein
MSNSGAISDLNQMYSNNECKMSHSDISRHNQSNLFLDESDREDNELFEDIIGSNDNTSSKVTNAATHQFQVHLHDLMMKHRTSLQLFDDICSLVNEYTSSPEFSATSKMQTRKAFLCSIAHGHNGNRLRPTNVNVRLHDNSRVTVPMFNIREMIISLLTDHSLMNESNFAEGYNVLTGEVDINHPSNAKYGKIHTGDAWLPARDRYCTLTEGPVMPVGIIVFGDKSHMDLHGTLSLTPVIFTLTLFNRSACNNTQFWRPIGYIPNLSYGKGVADKRQTKDKIQDEHTCLSCIFASLRNIQRDKGFALTFLGRNARVIVWIHYFIGDTEGNNKWLGQYPGNWEGVKCPYRDCKCTYENLSSTNPNCVYVSLADIREERQQKRTNEDGGKQYLKSVSHYDIKNALLEKDLPLSDYTHGPF